MTAVPVTDPCGLCGGEVLPLQLEDGDWVAFDLCGACNAAFQALASRLTPRPVGVVQVPGQLELDPS